MSQEPNPSPAQAEPARLQVLITAGAEDPHRARQGLETALAATAMGAEVSVFLTVRGAFWAEQREHDTCVIPGCKSILELIHELIEAGVLVECCSSCARHFTQACTAGDEALIRGIVVGGLASMLARTLAGTPTITF